MSERVNERRGEELGKTLPSRRWFRITCQVEGSAYIQLRIQTTPHQVNGKSIRV